MSQLGIMIERSVSLWDSLGAEILFYTLLGMSDRFLGHGLLNDFFEVFLKLLDFDFTQVPLVFGL